MLSMEVRIHSTENLKDLKRWALCQDLNPYLQVWTSPNAPKKRSEVQFGGGRSPSWNWRICDLEVDVNHMFKQTATLNVDVYHRGLTSDTLLGCTRIPLTFEYYEGRHGAGKTFRRWLYLKPGAQRGSITLSLVIFKKNPGVLKPYRVDLADGFAGVKLGNPVWKQCSSNLNHLQYANALVQSYKNIVSEGVKKKKKLVEKKSGLKRVKENAFVVYDNRICHNGNFSDDSEA